MADEELEKFLEEQLEAEIAGEEDTNILLPEYPVFQHRGSLLGEDHGEEDGARWLGVGEDGEERGIITLGQQLEKQKEDLERVKLCDKFYELVAERQELRRKNVFLQKKMAEFYKKRKMDHLLKVDPKGLDMDSKYLKRLLELKNCLASVEEGKNKINEKVQQISEKSAELKARVEKEQNEFLQKQRKVAAGLKLKTGRKISGKAIENFLAIQAANTDELSKLRLKEIKIKRLLAQNQDTLKELDSLGHGLRRADFEQLTYEYHNELRKYAERTEETEKVKTKAEQVTLKLHQAQHRATVLDRELTDWQQRTREMKEQITETKQRLYKLEKMRDNLKKEQLALRHNAGLLTLKPLLIDFERTVTEAATLKEKLDQEETITKARLVGAKGGQVNTPVELVEEPPEDANLIDAGSDDNDKGL